MLAPTIHLNGTSRESLTKEYQTATDALRAAINALAAITINGRDYYPQGDAAFQVAVNRRAEMLNTLCNLRTEVEAVVETLIDA